MGVCINAVGTNFMYPGFNDAISLCKPVARMLRGIVTGPSLSHGLRRRLRQFAAQTAGLASRDMLSGVFQENRNGAIVDEMHFHLGTEPACSNRCMRRA